MLAAQARMHRDRAGGRAVSMHARPNHQQYQRIIGQATVLNFSILLPLSAWRNIGQLRLNSAR